MTATNKPMTGAQLDELMAVAMRMQSDSEKMGERPVSMFAYAVQIAVLEIREVRSKYEELQSQNADMAVKLANAESKCLELAAENVTLNDKMNKLATWPGIEFYSSAWEFCNLDGNDALEFMCDVKTPATDAFLTEVRASAIRDALDESSDYLDTDCVMDRLDISYEDAELRTSGAIELHDALVAVANQLRKGE